MEPTSPKPPLPSATPSLSDKMRGSVTTKLFVVAGLVLLLLIPSFLIQNLIKEREMRRASVQRELGQAWGGAQMLAGPVLAVPYTVVRTTSDDKVVTSTEFAYFLPDSLDIDAQIAPQRMKRGLFEAVVYETTMEVAGQFSAPSFESEHIDPGLIRWDEARVLVGLSDLRGINEAIPLEWNGTVVGDFDPGLTAPLGGGSPPDYVDLNDYSRVMMESARGSDREGLTARVPLTPNAPEGGYSFRFSLDLNGSGALYATPVGKTTTATVTSPWPDPSFTGAFLPDERSVSDGGFTASYRVLHLNRSYPQSWSGGAMYPIGESAFGVRLLIAVDEYRQSMRAAKYAILILGLTFLTFFFAEVRERERVHPFQYILVGFALILFYALLLAISEHLPFNLAYLLSGGATIGLITLYARTIFSGERLALVVGGLLTVLYGYVFVLIGLQDYALLVGTLGLFGILALVMYLSRGVDWYDLR